MALERELKSALETISELKATNGECHVKNGTLKRSMASLTAQKEKCEATIVELESAKKRCV